MKEYYPPIIVLIFLVPIIISPITIEAISIEDEEANAIVQFESFLNVAQWQFLYREVLEPTMKDVIENWGEAEFPQDFKFDYTDNHQVYLLQINQTSGKFIFEMNAEGIMEGLNNVGENEFNQMYDGLLIQMKDLLVPFLIANNATNGKSFLDFTTGEVITNEF